MEDDLNQAAKNIFYQSSQKNPTFFENALKLMERYLATKSLRMQILLIVYFCQCTSGANKSTTE